MNSKRPLQIFAKPQTSPSHPLFMEVRMLRLPPTAIQDGAYYVQSKALMVSAETNKTCLENNNRKTTKESSQQTSR